jgi:hypothetical protein
LNSLVFPSWFLPKCLKGVKGPLTSPSYHKNHVHA